MAERRVHTFEVEVEQWVDDGEPSLDEGPVERALEHAFIDAPRDNLNIGVIRVRKTSEDA